MSDESQESLSKRERQKQRREARREAERNAAKRARMTRIAVFAVLGLVVAGGVGYFVQQTLSAQAEQAERVQQLASQAGCTDIQQPESLGRGHLDMQQLAQRPPEQLYQRRPTTTGRHLEGAWSQTGVFDTYVDERLTTHNLEHGYVVLWYAKNAPDDQIEALKTFAQNRIDAGDQEIVAAQYNAEMDQGANFAFTAWGVRRLCEQFEADVAAAFVDQYHNHSGAPETAAGPHLGGHPNTIDPKTQQAVFPPLVDSAGDEDATGGQGATGGQAETRTSGDAGGTADGGG